MRHGHVLKGFVLGVVALVTLLLGARPVVACRPAVADLIRDFRPHRTTASVRADHARQRPAKASQADRELGRSPIQVPLSPPVAQRAGASPERIEGYRLDGRGRRDPFTGSTVSRGARRYAAPCAAAGDGFSVARSSAVFHDANAPPARPFVVAGS